MSRKQINEPFLITPYSLLRTPEYLRFFDSASVGGVYRLLLTRVWRQGEKSLKYKSEGWVSRVASLYDDGWLPAYFSLDELCEATGFTPKSINNHLSTLEDLKLIRRDAFADGWLFLLGKRLRFESSSLGLSVGDDHEGYFIDAWESWLERDEVEFRTFLVEKLAPPKQKQAFLGKIFPSVEKNFSRTEPTETVKKSRAARDKSSVEQPLRIDKKRIKDLNSPKTEETPSGATISDATTVSSTDYSKRIRDAETNDDAVKVAREAYADGTSLHLINQVLASREPGLAFPKYPRFSFAASAYDPNPKNPHVALAGLWAALHEDITGVVATSTKKFYATVVGAYKNSLLKEYSHEQCLWTLHKVVREGGSSLDFLSQGGRNLMALVRQNAKFYQEMLEAKRISELQREANRIQDEKLAAAKSDDSHASIWDNIENDPWLQRAKALVDKRRAADENLKRLRTSAPAWKFDVASDEFVPIDEERTNA